MQAHGLPGCLATWEKLAPWAGPQPRMLFMAAATALFGPATEALCRW